MAPIVKQQHLDQLCPALQALLEAELAGGNHVVETSSGWPADDSIVVGLAKRFLARPAQMPPGVTYRLLSDPHWWYAEYEHAPSRHLLFCRF